MVLSAVEVNSKLQTQMPSHCETGINKEDPVFDVGCYNEHFFDVLLNDLNLKGSFPRLVSYINTSTPEEILGYLKGVEGFARENNDPKIPLSKRETILILGALLNIESTYIRFDVNKDNIIDNQTVVAYNGKQPVTELDAAFDIYRTAIIKVAKLKPEQEKYAKAIFLYMIKYMEIPPQGSWIDSGKFWYFYKWGSNKPIYAKRLNIGTLLYYLVNEKASSQNLKLKH
jgi:hypothetical protein